MERVFGRWTNELCAAITLMAICAAAQTAFAQTNVPAGAKFLATNLQGFGIPFQINANDGSYIEVQLYISEDGGKTWRFHDRRSTDKTEFPFQADHDGEYWFALKTLNRNRQLLPEGKTQPELVILVDTIKPELVFQIESDAAGRVACRWRATDKHLDPETLQILYQPLDGGQTAAWQKVPVNLNGVVRNGLYGDQVAWWPETTAQSLNVRIAIADSAGNLIQQDRTINLAPSPWRHRSTGTARTGDAVSSGQVLNQPGTNGVLSPPVPVHPFPQNDQASHTQPRILHHATTPPPVKTAPPLSDSNMVCEKGVCRVDHARSAAAGETLARKIQVPLIGGEPEIAAPPIPSGYIPREPLVAQLPNQHSNPRKQNPHAGSGSVPWNSESERWTTPHQSSSSTTGSPDPRMLPNPYVEKQTSDQHLPPANVNTMKTVGDQVIGESSTLGPNNQNQYRGLSSPSVFASQSSVAQPPEEMARPSVNESAAAGWPNQGTQTPAGESTNNGPIPVAGGTIIDSNDFDPSLQMIGSKRFRLNYGIDAIDPSGVAKVDLWMTRDGGKTWTAWGSDPDNTSPFPVEVQEEGRYGFRIVVQSKDGLTGRGPSSGDAADIWVHVDTQSPLAQIISVPFGRGEEAGRLVVNYRVADPFLTLRPITIAYSRNPDGPWTAIGEGLRNESRFLWKPTSNVPDRIFLRLEARDRAGNLGVHQLTQAIDVSGLVPRGTIHGVIPVGVER